jgi:putative transcriptional regulator
VADSLRGRLLVAGPSLIDPNFFRTVVLVLEHTDDGALGIVLNRPSPMRVADPLPRWEPVAAAPAVVFVGGPVGDGVAIGIGSVPARPDGEDAGFQPVVGTLASVDLAREPDEIAPVEWIRVFAGYAGWAAGQLEEELELGGWLVVDALADDVSSSDPAGLWRAVLKRQPGRVAWLANFPDDPRAN